MTKDLKCRCGCKSFYIGKTDNTLSGNLLIGYKCTECKTFICAEQFEEGNYKWN